MRQLAPSCEEAVFSQQGTTGITNLRPATDSAPSERPRHESGRQTSEGRARVPCPEAARCIVVLHPHSRLQNSADNRRDEQQRRRAWAQPQSSSRSRRTASLSGFLDFSHLARNSPSCSPRAAKSRADSGSMATNSTPSLIGNAWRTTSLALSGSSTATANGDDSA